jgi:NDP-sugar pyrophosphorylase family protein
LCWIPKNEYLDFPNLIQKLLEFDQKIFCYPSNDFWLDIGRHEDYAEAQRVFPEMKEKLLYE